MTLHPPLVRVWQTTLMGVLVSGSAAAFAVVAPPAGGQQINGQTFNTTACAKERWPLNKPTGVAAHTCRFEGTRSVAYGAKGKFVIRTATGSIDCSNAAFGDPIKGTGKACYLNVATLGNTAAPNPAVKPAPTPSQNDAAAKAAAHKTAMLLWRNDLPVKHPKGSCAGCHGADFFDLARIGTTEADIVRRALTDGATAAEAEALRVAILNMRKDMKLPATNARTFRPFQPGGQVLLPELNEPLSNVAAVKRDIAFAEGVSKLLPTFYGPRIGTLAQAQKARDEMLDIARGTNQGGANTRKVQLRDLPVGIEYPLWSADKFHGTKEGTFNDWVSDLAFIPKPDRKVEWEALQNAYLARPANDTFWPMYAAVDTMLQLATPLGACTAPDGSGNTTGQVICSKVHGGFEHKLKSALIGQHLMRLDALGRRSEFVQGALAFSYLDTQPIAGFKLNAPFLPSDPWDVGDVLARQTLPNVKTLGPASASLGLPQFVVDSIDANKSTRAEEHDIRLSWMWIGFTFEPTFQRMSASNSTKSSEYLIGTLLERKLFNHTAFMTNMRLMSTYLPEGSVDRSKTSPTGVSRVPRQMNQLIDFSYSVAYDRHVGRFGPDSWGEGLAHKPDYRPVPQALKDQSMALWSTQFGNGMRATLLLLLDELQNRPAGISKDWLTRQAAEIQKSGVSNWGMVFREHWAKYQPQHSAADSALVDQVAQAIVKAAGL